MGRLLCASQVRICYMAISILLLDIPLSFHQTLAVIESA